jgi:hypothetical protein
MNLNSSTQSKTPFTIGIQIEWQLEMMENIGHNNALDLNRRNIWDHPNTGLILTSSSFTV